MASSSKSQPKNNREFAAQSGPSGPKRPHSPQPELNSAEAQASGHPQAKKKSGKSNWSRKKGRRSGKSNWASYNSQREKGNSKKQKTDSTAEEKTESMHRKPSGRLVQQAVRAESPLPPKTQGVQTDPNFFLLTDLKLPDTPFENAESEIGDFLDDEEDEIFFMAILVAKTGFGAPRRILFNVISTSRLSSELDLFRARARQQV